jgi:hypothetical protein
MEIKMAILGSLNMVAIIRIMVEVVVDMANRTKTRRSSRL